MSRVTAIFGTDDDEEILESLYLIANVRISFSLATGCDSNPTTEHKWTGFHSRISEHTQQLRLHTAMVRLGEQLFCGDDA
jgi:hypothetical protein